MAGVWGSTLPSAVLPWLPCLPAQAEQPGQVHKIGGEVEAAQALAALQVLHPRYIVQRQVQLLQLLHHLNEAGRACLWLLWHWYWRSYHTEVQGVRQGRGQVDRCAPLRQEPLMLPTLRRCSPSILAIRLFCSSRMRSARQCWLSSSSRWMPCACSPISCSVAKQRSLCSARRRSRSTVMRPMLQRTQQGEGLLKHAARLQNLQRAGTEGAARGGGRDALPVCHRGRRVSC